MKTVVRNERSRGEKRRNRSIIALAMLVLFVVLASCSYSGYQELQSLRRQYGELEEKNLEEQERAEELTQREAYMQTIGYLIEVARDKLGLVFPDDTVLRQEKEEE